jgi:replicative DNA helicase
MTSGNYKKKVKLTEARSAFIDVVGKVPPHALDLEIAVLGGLILENGHVMRVSNILTPDSFYKEANAIIYEAILDLYKRRAPIDILTVTEEVKKLGKLEVVGGATYITELTSRLSSTANIEYHALIVQEKYFGREIIKKSAELFNKAFDETEDFLDLIDEAKSFFNSIVNVKQAKTKSAGEIVKATKNDLKSTTKVLGKLSGLTILDYRTGGAHDSDLIIIAGRPGKGKTVLALTYVRHQLSVGKKTSTYSYEMTAKQLVLRLVSMEKEINNNRIRAKKLTPDQEIIVDKFLDSIPKDAFYVNDSNPDLYTLLTLIENDVVQNGVQLIAIDYIQLIPVPKELANKRKDEQIGKISFALKSLAKKLNVPIIALSQLSRESEKREEEGKWVNYKMSDLRESGSLEQDADMILFVDQMGKKGRIQMAKFRHGATATSSFIWNGDYVRFEDDLEDKPTRMAIAHYEKTGEIDLDFEYELKKMDQDQINEAIDTIPKEDQGDYNPLWEQENASSPTPF